MKTSLFIAGVLICFLMADATDSQAANGPGFVGQDRQKRSLNSQAQHEAKGFVDRNRQKRDLGYLMPKGDSSRQKREARWDHENDFIDMAHRQKREAHRQKRKNDDDDEEEEEDEYDYDY